MPSQRGSRAGRRTVAKLCGGIDQQRPLGNDASEALNHQRRVSSGARTAPRCSNCSVNETCHPTPITAARRAECCIKNSVHSTSGKIELNPTLRSRPSATLSR